jgi:hypothetical protein
VELRCLSAFHGIHGEALNNKINFTFKERKQNYKLCRQIQTCKPVVEIGTTTFSISKRTSLSHTSSVSCTGFEVIRVVNAWIVSPRCLGSCFQRFGGRYHLHLQCGSAMEHVDMYL